MILFVLFYAALGLFGGYIVAHKGYRPMYGILYGIVAGFLFGPFALIAALLLPATEEGRQRAAQQLQTQQELAYSKQTQSCPRCGRKNSVVARVCPKCELRFEEAIVAE